MVQFTSTPRSVAYTRNLILVSFLTLTLTGFLFLFAILQFDRTSRAMLHRVDSSVASLAWGTELNRQLVSLELDIRELIYIILHESYRLTAEKEKLRARFAQIAAMAEEKESSPQRQALSDQLDRYRTSFEKLLWDYGAVNSALYEVYFFLNSFDEQFQYLSETAAQLLANARDAGRRDRMQQAFVLIAHAHEQMLQVHILVNSSLADSDPLVLVAEERKLESGSRYQSVPDKLMSAVNTLQTLRDADQAIASYADDILATFPLFRENIDELAVAISTLDRDYAEFRKERDACLQRLEEANIVDRERMQGLGRTLASLSRKGTNMAWFLAVAVLLVAGIGLLMTRKMGGHLARTAEEALLAQKRGEELNLKLQEEIEQRQQAADELRLARDELEERVQQRTAQLSASNRSLAMEIEERRNIEYALASEKERLSVTLRSIGDGVITTGVDGTVMLLNKVAEELTGWSQKEAYGRPLSEVFRIVHKKSGELFVDMVTNLLRSGSISNLGGDAVLIARNGSRRDIDDSGAPIRDRDSVIIGVVLVFRDITVKRKMEEDALKSEKLKSVGVLAGGIAHDFNNILAAILGNINMARLQVGKGEGERATKLLEDAEKASLRARRLTQQLLTFAKGGDPVRKVEHLADIIRDSTDFIISGGKVHCRYQIAGDLWPVNIDAGQVSQVIQNIVINAMHAMPEGGLIEIGCENFVNDQRQVASLAAGNYVRLSIRDQGTGIPEEHLNRIFDPYFTTKAEGSGLGLALTHSIISKHQGHIEVQSGSWGTVFTLYFPALPEYQVQREAAGTESELRPNRARILIMDDEDMVREIAREMLVHLGFEVETASDGADAVALYRERLAAGTPVDLVIMDLTVPGGMGGKEAIRRLRELDPEVRAIVSSGYSNDPVMAEYQRYGFVGVVNKPFQLHELLQAVNEVLTSSDK